MRHLIMYTHSNFINLVKTTSSFFAQFNFLDFELFSIVLSMNIGIVLCFLVKV